MKAIIFTDLDGCLLNHDDYSFEAAMPILARIKHQGIPLIITTSKSRSEVERIRNSMGIDDPFIVENGGGVFFMNECKNIEIPSSIRAGNYHLIVLGMTYERIRTAFAAIKTKLHARGFGDLSVTEISDLTGLSMEDARLAKCREFTEPFLLNSDQDVRSAEDLAGARGMKIMKGGRFYHLMGITQDKGVAVRFVLNVFRRHAQEKIISIGVGDSENDRPLLQAVDIPVLIPHLDGRYSNISLPGMIKAAYPGSMGWRTAMEGILNELETNPH